MKAAEVDRSRLSPMMQHYLKVKDENPGIIVFYRIGDFYEMFFDDAELVSRELELTLTGKDCGLDERAPMCGIPHHAAESYIARLIKKGYKVAICEQVEDPKTAKGLVDRKVIRIITPGTALEDGTLNEDRNNYIMCVARGQDVYGIATADVSTGLFTTTSVQDAAGVMNEITKLEPRELVYAAGGIFPDLPDAEKQLGFLKEKLSVAMTEIPQTDFEIKGAFRRLTEHFHVAGVEGFGLRDYPECVQACGALIAYLTDTEMDALSQINRLQFYLVSNYMIIDSATRRNLELTETMRDKKKRGSLLWVLDHTRTAMGARTLRHFLDTPLMDKDAISDRLDAVASMNENIISRDEIREYLNSVYDLERLCTRISIRTANPHDLLMFRNSLQYLPFIRNDLKEQKGKIFSEMAENFDTLGDLYQLIDSAIDEDAPVTIREGGIFKTGYNADIDRFKDAKKNSKGSLAEIEAREREKTGIRNLRVRFNRIFGYFFEVTNSYKNLVPDYFIRKQTLTNAERFTTSELQQLSDLILGSEDKLSGLEYDEYVKLRDRLAAETRRIQKTADQIGLLDALASLSYTAVHYHYVRPEINTAGRIDIRGGRHPVVERMMGDGGFIPNDTVLDEKDNRIMLITGPNMAGKSTYMRQTALICLMAQIGSFVPADQADICISDRIFTRVGASDDLAEGQSTFMVEMSEVAGILRNATKRSLIIMDEIGRGTSTFDGLSIAWAVLEYIADEKKVGAKTLFATHYHELTELEGKLKGVHNFCVAIRKEKGNLIFLRKIIPGDADRSYGIEVAELAGVPEAVTERAKEIAGEISGQDLSGRVRDLAEDFAAGKKKETDAGNIRDERNEKVLQKLQNADPNRMTPVDALLFLQELRSGLGDET